MKSPTSKMSILGAIVVKIDSVSFILDKNMISPLQDLEYCSSQSQLTAQVLLMFFVSASELVSNIFLYAMASFWSRTLSYKVMKIILYCCYIVHIISYRYTMLKILLQKYFTCVVGRKRGRKIAVSIECVLFFIVCKIMCTSSETLGKLTICILKVRETSILPVQG